MNPLGQNLLDVGNFLIYFSLPSPVLKNPFFYLDLSNNRPINLSLIPKALIPSGGFMAMIPDIGITTLTAKPTKLI